MTLEWKRYEDREEEEPSPPQAPKDSSFQRLILNGKYVGFIYKNHRGEWRAVRDGNHLTVQTEEAAKLAVELL